MSERLIIDKANIADATMNAISAHMEKNDLTYENMLEDIVIVQFKDGLIRAELTYDEKNDQYVINTEELKTGDEVIQHVGESLHMIKSDKYINQYM